MSAHITFVCLFDCHLFFQQGLPCLVDAFSPRLRNHLGIPGWVFCLRRNFHSLPLVRVLSFFFTPREHFLCSCALLRQDVCSLPPEFLSEFLVYEGRMDPGFFDSFCQKDLFSHKRMTFRGTLLGSLSFSGPDPEAFYWGCAGSHLFQWELFSFSSCFPHLLSTSHRLFEDHL